MLKSADGRRVPVHIAVVTITGGINETVKDQKDQQCPPPIAIDHLAQSKPVHRHEEKGEMKGQQLECGRGTFHARWGFVTIFGERKSCSYTILNQTTMAMTAFIP